MLTKMELFAICWHTERNQIQEHPNPGVSPFRELGARTHRGAGHPCSRAPHTRGNLETADQQKYPYEHHHSETSKLSLNTTYKLLLLFF